VSIHVDKDQIRVEIFPLSNDKDGASITTFDATTDVQWFDNPEDLPQWVKERVAVLTVMGKNKVIAGIGEQTLAHVFWINIP
jgi:hypothetical protein